MNCLIDMSATAKADALEGFFAMRGNTESSASSWGLESIVAELRLSREQLHRTRHPAGIRELPSREALVAIIDGLKIAMFPTHYGKSDLTDESVDYYVGSTLDATLGMLSHQIKRALRFANSPSARDEAALSSEAVRITRTLATRLPALRALLVSDIYAAFAGDPAASHITEILLCYPGIEAILHQRVAHELCLLGVPLLARLITEIAHSKTGIDIHPAATIGERFFIDHGTGVVIGETAIIGNNVRLYQAVTLGAKRFHTNGNGALIKGEPRHPIVEDDVVIYAGATILGRVTIGRGSVIGGNVWLTESVGPGSVISQSQLVRGEGGGGPEAG